MSAHPTKYQQWIIAANNKVKTWKKMQKGDMKLLFFKIYFVFPNFSEGNKTAEVSEGMFTSALNCLSHNTA